MMPRRRSPSRTTRAALALVLLSILAHASGALAQPLQTLALLIEPDMVIASGLPAGGSAVFFGASRRPVGHFERNERRVEIVADVDGDGAAFVEEFDGVAANSVWAAVDLASGAFALATPGDFPIREVAFPGRGIGAALRSLEHEGLFADVVWVRPGVGAWELTAKDGGPADSDAEPNGRVRFAVEAFEALGSSPPAPERFGPGDVLVAIELDSLTIYAAQLAH
jgi:hypothetical protein